MTRGSNATRMCRVRVRGGVGVRVRVAVRDRVGVSVRVRCRVRVRGYRPSSSRYGPLHARVRTQASLLD